MRTLDPGEAGAARVLTVAPHPDDEAVGCGGTVRLFAQAGATVSVVIMARGDGGVDGAADVEQRHDESRRCCEILGVEPPVFLDVPSPELRSDPLSAATLLAERMGRGVHDVVLVPSPLERHDTHRAALLAALLSGVGREGAQWWGYGVWDAIPADDGAVEIDITAARSTKTMAIAAHRSQDGARSLAAGMAARDMAQAVFSRITGDERRKAVERLMDLRGLRAAVGAADDATGASSAIRDWVTDAGARWADGLWGR